MSSTGYVHFWMRPQLHIGAGALVRLSTILQELGARRVLVVTDPGIKAAGLLDRVLQIFKDNPYPNQPQLTGVYSNVEPDSTSTCINDVIREARAVNADSIVALGGGSVLDTAKAVKYCLQHNHSDICPVIASGFRMETSPPAAPSGIPLVSIPTTAGTGADVSSGAVILDMEKNSKSFLGGAYFDSDVSLLDANLTLGLPPSITADTGMDALTHATEALCSYRANPMSDAFAFAAIRIICRDLPVVVDDGSKVTERGNMLQAASMAIEAGMHAVGETLVHNCSHALGALHHIPHGRANAVLLPVVMEEVQDFYRPHAKKLCEAFYLPTEGLSDEAMLASVIDRINSVKDAAGCPDNFAEFGVKAEGIEQMMGAIMADPLYALYQVPPDRIEAILRKIAS